MNYLQSLRPLLFRNLVFSLDKDVIIWNVGLLAVLLIFVSGYSYTGLFNGKDIVVGNFSIPYPAYLTVGVIGINSMFSAVVTGATSWDDKRNGMFEQILLMPYGRSHYAISSVITMIIMGLVGGILTLAIGLPTLIGLTYITVLNAVCLVTVVISCSIFYGSILIIISILTRGRESYSVIVNGLAISTEASTAIYPSTGVNEALYYFFYLNPMTYIVEILRKIFFTSIDNQIVISILILLGTSLLLFLGAILLMHKKDV